LGLCGSMGSKHERHEHAYAGEPLLRVLMHMQSSVLKS